MFQISRLVSFLAPALVVAATASGQGFTDLGAIIPVDMSADGSIVTGPDSSFSSGAMWTATGGLQLIGGSGDAYVSCDGASIVGSAINQVTGKEEAAIWLGGTDWQLLGGIGDPCDAFLSSGWNVSDTGMLVGLGWLGCDAHAISWDQGNGMVDLGTAHADSSRADDISCDGSVIVGWSEGPTGWWEATRWIGGVPQLLDPVLQPGEANATNSDGSIIVGSHYPGGPQGYDSEAWYWTEATGVVSIGRGVTTNPSHSCWAFDVSDDGGVIVGACGFGGDRIPFIWTPHTGMVRLTVHLVAAGITGWESWDLSTPTAVSADGTVIAGWGFLGFDRKGYRIELPLFFDGFESGDTSAWSVAVP